MRVAGDCEQITNAVSSFEWAEGFSGLLGAPFQPSFGQSGAAWLIADLKISRERRHYHHEEAFRPTTDLLLPIATDSRSLASLVMTIF